MGRATNQIPAKVIEAPYGYRAPPRLRVLAAIPMDVREALDPLWNETIVRSGPVRIYHLTSVFVAAEGLVFEDDGGLLDHTITTHAPQTIDQARGAVAAAVRAGRFSKFPRGILAIGPGAENYGHFIYEMLPRVRMARAHLPLEDWPAIILATRPRLENVAKQSLGRTGTAADNIIKIGREPVFFDELIHVDGLTRHARHLSPFVMPCLDDITRDISAGTIRKVYAARAPARWRDFENIRRTESVLAKLGFTKIVAAHTSFEEQVSVFKGASDVVGVAGAALTNAVFCAPGTRLTVFMPHTARELLFWMIAEARRLHYKEVRCLEVGPLEPGGLPWDRAIRLSRRQISEALETKPPLVDTCSAYMRRLFGG